MGKSNQESYTQQIRQGMAWPLLLGLEDDSQPLTSPGPLAKASLVIMVPCIQLKPGQHTC